MKRTWGGVTAAMIITVAALSSATVYATESSTTSGEDEVTLYLVRHGETMLNTTDRVQGWSDAVLTPEGLDVVEAAGEGMAHVPFQAAYSSDSGRAIQTAEVLLEENEASTEVDLHHDDRLREFNFGSYEGDLNETMWTDIADSRGISLEEFHANPDPEAFANSVAELDVGRAGSDGNWPAEDYTTVTARLTEAIDDIVQEESSHGNGNVLLVSHGLSIQALIDTLFPDYELAPGGIANASTTIITYRDGEFELGAVNDTDHIGVDQ